MRLHDYQLTGVQHLHAHRRAGLFMDMGLGKTATVLSALTPDHLPAVVLAPPRVAELVWPAEAATWRPDLRVVLGRGSPKERAAQIARLGTDADVLVLGMSSVAELKGWEGQFRTLVLDELSCWKNRGTSRWKQTRALAMATPHVWGLTGTPSPNGMMDLWAQMYLLDQGARLGRTLTAYRQAFFKIGMNPNGRPAQLQNGVVTRWDILPGAQDTIMASIEDICLSMTTEGRLALPPLTHNVVLVALPPKARQAYRKLKKDLLVGRDVLGEQFTATNAAVLSSRLSQLTAGFLYRDEQALHPGEHTVVHTEKVEAVKEIIEGTGSPVLVLYRFRAELGMLQAALPGARTLDEPGVLRDWDAGQVPVLLAHPASVGHGLNLQHGGHTAIWTSLPWSLEQWRQANKRLLRQGQQHPVVIHSVEAANSVDQVVHDRLDGKAAVEDLLMSHLESPV